MSDLTTVVDWSRLQFAITAIYHWLFVPLTLGLSVIVAIMESIYLKTKSEKWLLPPSSGCVFSESISQ